MFRVIGGGFYRYIKNNRTGRGWWRREGEGLKRTERETFTEEEAREILAQNSRAFVKMAGAEMVEA